MKRSQFPGERIIGTLKEQEASAAFYKWKANSGGLEVPEAKRPQPEDSCTVGYVGLALEPGCHVATALTSAVHPAGVTSAELNGSDAFAGVARG